MTNYSRRQLASYAVNVLTEGLDTGKLPTNLAAAMINSGRQKEVGLLLADIDQQLEDRGLLARAHVTAAHSLPERLSTELEKQIKAQAGVKAVDLVVQVDKEQLGGVKVETASHSWDNTIRKRLDTIREAV